MQKSKFLIFLWLLPLAVLIGAVYFIYLSYL